MDKEDGAGVELDVLLERGLLGLVLVAGETAVHEAEGLSHSTEDEELDDGPVDVEEHGADKGGADLVEPNGVEVGDTGLLGEDVEEAALLAHIGVYEEEEKSGVEELHDEDSVGDEAGLLGLGVLANVDNELDNEDTEDHVDNDDANGDELVVEESLNNGGREVSAELVGVARESFTSFLF
jgi:hypothetical protein